MPDVIAKINSEKEKISSFFDDMIKAGLKEIVNRMDALIGFWEASYQDIPVYLKALRLAQGPSFDGSAVVSLPAFLSHLLVLRGNSNREQC